MRPIWILVAFAAVAASYFASDVLIPLVIALFLSILFEPLVARLEALGLRRGRGAALVVLCFLAAVGGGIWAFSQPFSRIAADLPLYSERIRTDVSALDRGLHRFEKSNKLVENALRSSPERDASADGVNSWRQFLWRGLGSFFEAAGIVAFVPFLMVVILSEKEVLVDSFERIVGESCDVGLIDREAARMIRAYFYGNFLAGVAMAFLHCMLFASLGLKNALGLGLVAGLLTLIPLIGLPAALILPAAQGLLQLDRVPAFVFLATGMTALHLLTANYVVPRVIGGRVKLNATAAMAGLLFWGWLWGVTGLVLAVPLTALLKILLESNKDTEAYAGLLAGPRKMGPEDPSRPRAAVLSFPG